MKNLIVRTTFSFVCLAALISCGGKSPETDLKGHYHGKNLFIQNPYGPEGVGFCIIEIKVNGKTTTDEINSTAVEIDLGALGTKDGDAVEVELIHKKGCEPKVLNPEVLQ